MCELDCLDSLDFFELRSLSFNKVGWLGFGYL